MVNMVSKKGMEKKTRVFRGTNACFAKFCTAFLGRLLTMVDKKSPEHPGPEVPGRQKK